MPKSEAEYMAQREACQALARLAALRGNNERGVLFGIADQMVARGDELDIFAAAVRIKPDGTREVICDAG